MIHGCISDVWNPTVNIGCILKNECVLVQFFGYYDFIIIIGGFIDVLRFCGVRLRVWCSH